ncbi:MAG: hypothetical protein ABF805_01975 [Bifidobacterium sp.]
MICALPLWMDEETLSNPSGALADYRVVISGTHSLGGNEYGWKLVNASNTVVALGSSSAGTMTVPDDVRNGEYTLWYWGQQDGTAAKGWSNKATVPHQQSVTLQGSLTSLPYTGSAHFWWLIALLAGGILLLAGYLYTRAGSWRSLSRSASSSQ